MKQQNKQIERFITKTIFFSLITFNFLHGADDRKTSNFQQALQACKDRKRIEIYDKEKGMNYNETNELMDSFFEATPRDASFLTKANLEDLETLHLLMARGNSQALEEMKQQVADYTVYSSANELASNVLRLFTNPNTKELKTTLFNSVFKMYTLAEGFIDGISKENIDALKQNTATAFQRSQDQARLLNYNIGLLIGTPLGGLFTWYSLISLIKSGNYFGLNFIANNLINTNRCVGVALAGLTAYIACRCYHRAKKAKKANKTLNAALSAEMIFTKAEKPQTEDTVLETAK